MTPYRESANPLVKRAPKTPWWRLLRAFFWSKRMDGKCALGIHLLGTHHMSREQCSYFATPSTLWLRLKLREARQAMIAHRVAKKKRWRETRRLKKEEKRLKMARTRAEEDAIECQRKAWAHARAQMERIHARILDMNRRPKC